jgi:hypothetical protein
MHQVLLLHGDKGATTAAINASFFMLRLALNRALSRLAAAHGNTCRWRASFLGFQFQAGCDLTAGTRGFYPVQVAACWAAACFGSADQPNFIFDALPSSSFPTGKV